MSAKLEQARELARGAWAQSKKGRCVVKKSCEKCTRMWRMAGRKLDERPPLFPIDYNGSCPICGGELRGMCPL